MRASSKRMISFVVSLALIVGAVLTYAFLMAPAYDEIQKARSDLVLETQAYNDQKEIFDKIKDLNDKYKGNGTLQDAVSLALPDEVFVSQILGGAQGLASLNHMTILSAQTEVLPLRADASSPSYIKNIGTVKLTLQTHGSYGDFKKFLSQIENNYRIMDVMQLDIKTDTNDKTQSSYAYGLTLYAYYQDVTKVGTASLRAQ